MLRRPRHAGRALVRVDPRRASSASPFGRYMVLTLIGSAIWCFALAGIGWALGSSYESFHHDFGYVEIRASLQEFSSARGYLVLRSRRATRLDRRASDPTR